MESRRSLRLVAGALVLALPLLSSCGFGKATDRVYTPAEGTNNRDGVVDVLSAVVVSAQPGSGTFIASLSNNSPDEENSFDGLAGAGEWQDLEIGTVEEVELPARGFANLVDDGGVSVTGDFEPGEVVELSLTFGNGEVTTMEVPVVYACEEYLGLDTSVAGATTEEPEATDEPSPGQVPTDGATPSPTEEASESAPAEDTYACAVVLEE